MNTIYRINEILDELQELADDMESWGCLTDLPEEEDPAIGYERETLFLTLKEYDKKIKELMEPEMYRSWSAEVSLRIYKADIDRLPEGDFKDFCIKNFTMITGARYDEVL